MAISLSSRNSRALPVRFHMPVRTVRSYSPAAGGVSMHVQRTEYFAWPTAASTAGSSISMSKYPRASVRRSFGSP